VAGLLKEPVGATREYRIEAELLLNEGEESRQDVSGEANFLRTPRGVLVTASVAGTAADACSRCLGPVIREVELNLEEEFVQTVDIDTGGPLGQPSDPDDFRIDAHHVLDLEDAVRQYWSAALPMQVLCRPGCLGLCSRCGADMNAGPHECEPEVDERWSALSALGSKKEGS
jgi:uncharacterized protein